SGSIVVRSTKNESILAFAHLHSCDERMLAHFLLGETNSAASLIEPSNTTCPFSSTIPRWQSSFTVPTLWLTTNIVLPDWLSSFIFTLHFSRKAASPTDRISSTRRISSSVCTATEK